MSFHEISDQPFQLSRIAYHNYHLDISRYFVIRHKHYFRYNRYSLTIKQFQEMQYINNTIVRTYTRKAKTFKGLTDAM